MSDTNIDTMRAQAESLYALKRYKEAEDLTRRMLSSEPDNDRFYVFLAWSQLQQNKDEMGVNSADQAIGFNPANAEAFRAKCVGLFRLNRLAQATEAANHSLSLNPDSPKTLMSRIDISLAQIVVKFNNATSATVHHAQLAWSDISQTLLLDPESAGGHFRAARYHLLFGNDDYAKASLLKVLSVEPEDARSHELLGLLEQRSGDTHSAAQHFVTAGRNDLNNPNPLNQLKALALAPKTVLAVFIASVTSGLALWAITDQSMWAFMGGCLSLTLMGLVEQIQRRRVQKNVPEAAKQILAAEGAKAANGWAATMAISLSLVLMGAGWIIVDHRMSGLPIGSQCYSFDAERGEREYAGDCSLKVRVNGDEQVRISVEPLNTFALDETLYDIKDGELVQRQATFDDFKETLVDQEFSAAALDGQPAQILSEPRTTVIYANTETLSLENESGNIVGFEIRITSASPEPTQAAADSLLASWSWKL